MIELNFFMLMACSAVVFTTWLLIHVSVGIPIKKEKEAWAFYAIRDRLIALVYKDKLKKDSLIFMHFYPQVNLIISNIDILKFSNFVQGLNRNNQATIEKYRILKKELDLCAPEVKEVIYDYFGTIVCVLLENSLLLKAVIFASDFMPHKPRVIKTKDLPIKRELVKTWSDARTLEARFAPI